MGPGAKAQPCRAPAPMPTAHSPAPPSEGRVCASGGLPPPPASLWPLPSWPKVAHPQHCVCPLLSVTHVCARPEVIHPAVAYSPVTALGDGYAFVASIVPLPSCPAQFAPQHFTAPPCSSAQLCDQPHDTATAPEMPFTPSGAVAMAAVPFSPFVPLPQHFTVP